MKAIVLAGGLGTRLRTEVPDLPKPLAPVGGRPFLAWKLDALDKAGFTEVVLSVGYRAQAIIDAFGDTYGQLKLRYVTEDRPLGTGGALRKALATLPANEPIWAMNGDTFVALDYAQMYAQHDAVVRSAVTMAVVQVADGSRYGTVEVRAGRVVQFRDKGLTGAGFINAGVYLLGARLFEGSTLPDAFSFEQDFLGAQVTSLDLRAYVTDGYFIDIGIPADFARAQIELPKIARG